MGLFDGLLDVVTGGGYSAGKKADKAMKNQAKLYEGMDWKNPYTPEQIAGMNTIANMNTEQYRREMQNNMMMNLAQRGLSGAGVTSTADIANQSGLQNWLLQQMAMNRANTALMGVQRGDQLRQEMSGNYQNQANTYGQQASAGYGMLGSIAGMALGGGFNPIGLMGLNKSKQQVGSQNYNTTNPITTNPMDLFPNKYK